MRHARSDYNHIQDPTGKIGEAGPTAVLAWADAAEKLGAAPEMIRRVREWAELMATWGTKKVPAAPKEALR